MARPIVVQIEIPGDMRTFRFPKALNRRLQDLLDKQDRGEKLTAAERREAAGLVHVAEVYSFLRMRAERTRGRQTK